jgi:hypothetical protein
MTLPLKVDERKMNFTIYSHSVEKQHDIFFAELLEIPNDLLQMGKKIMELT